MVHLICIDHWPLWRLLEQRCTNNEVNIYDDDSALLVDINVDDACDPGMSACNLVTIPSVRERVRYCSTMSTVLGTRLRWQIVSTVDGAYTTVDTTKMWL